MTSSSPTCFVAMPIRMAGTEEHAHFLAIYEQGIKPAVLAAGYTIIRADEVQIAGAITKDVVRWLSDADLVVADLTDQNPNVFYELGVRHSLRASGTVMTRDVSRTPDIPFDLSAYRVLSYRGDLIGIGNLRQQLEVSIRDMAKVAIGHRDNPVHDTLPILPSNAAAAAQGSVEAPLREQLAEAQERLRRYERAYGHDGATSSISGRSPLEVVAAAVRLAQDGGLPIQVVARAQDAVRSLDATGFLNVLQSALERGTRLSDAMFVTLASYARQVGLDEVVPAIYDHALVLYPKSKSLRTNQLSHLLGSQDPVLREQSRKEVMAELGISVHEDGTVTLASNMAESKLFLFSRLLDGLRSDELFEQSLRLTDAMLSQFPKHAVALRNHARALVDVDRREDAYLIYQRALWAEQATDASTAADWFAIDLYNVRRYVDALEVHIVASQLDPDDASYFAFAALSLSRALKQHRLPGSRRALPSSMNRETVELLLRCAMSCPDFTQADHRRCDEVAAAFSLQLGQKAEAAVTIEERLEILNELYSELRSTLTTPVDELPSEEDSSLPVGAADAL
jgi:tetratricopeptide (TPR) repeat protein